ncbi:hypothetical protein B0H12DRAFT_1310181 [Mycena haematopus]|nr:hypothetical protein B0H12DRAFT_1310181 [Mycena haematopus]
MNHWKTLLATTILATTVAASQTLSHNTTGSSGSSDCTVQAWVRAEDLAPNYVSHGELRIKVIQAHCADKIASVALRLQLDEFGEVKHLRQGAVIPEIQKADNQTLPDDLFSFGFWGSSGPDANEVVYDYGPYDRAMSDHSLWVVHAEQRRAWSTEVTLLENNHSMCLHILLVNDFRQAFHRVFSTDRQTLHCRLTCRQFSSVFSKLSSSHS